MSWRRIREWIDDENAAGTALADQLADWYEAVEAVTWTKFADVRASFGKRVDRAVVASGEPVYVFNVAGNNMRIVAAIHFNTGMVYVLRVMTHEGYDQNEWKRNL